MTARITIVHTNDFHCAMERWPRTAAVVKAELERARAAGRPAIYVDAGDFLEVSERIAIGTRGAVANRLLGALGCAAFVPGNNETVRLHPRDLRRLAEGAPFPWLCANMRDASGADLMRDATLVDAGPVRVGIIGVTAPYPSQMAWMGYTLADLDPLLRSAPTKLRENGADLVVLLSHAGFLEDQQWAGAGYGFDLIIGGHSHEVVAEPVVIEGVRVTQAGMFGEYVGVLDIEVDVQTRRVHSCQGRLIHVDSAGVAPDPDTVALVAEVEAESDRYLGEVLTVLDQPMPHESTGESPLCCLLAEGLRRQAGAEIGLCIGAAAVRGFAAGPVTRGAVTDAVTSLFIPARLELSGETLLALLRQSADPAIHAGETRAAGLRPYGVPVGRMFTAGITHNEDVTDVRVNGAPLEVDRVYTAGAPSVMAFPRTGYPAFADLRITHQYGGLLTRDIMEAMLAGALTRD